MVQPVENYNFFFLIDLSILSYNVSKHPRTAFLEEFKYITKFSNRCICVWIACHVNLFNLANKKKYSVQIQIVFWVYSIQNRTGFS